MSGHKLDDQELAALRASVVSVRCGRSLPLVHLSELDEVFTQRRLHRAPIVLCGVDVADPDHDDDGHDCPGCADCLRYCPDCVRLAVKAVLTGPDPAERGPDFAAQPAVNDTQLAVLFRQVQWALDDAAHDWPAGRVTPRGREEIAGTLESLATIVRASAVPDVVVIDSET